MACASSRGGGQHECFRVDCKPGPVPTRGCPRAGEDHSSRRHVAVPLERSHPGTQVRLASHLRTGRPRTAPLFKLALGRACLAAGHPAVARGLLPHDFTLTGQVRQRRTCHEVQPGRSREALRTGRRTSAVSFLLRFPSGRPGSVLPTSLPCRARTFLPRTVLVRRRSSVHLRRAEARGPVAPRQRADADGEQPATVGADPRFLLRFTPGAPGDQVLRSFGRVSLVPIALD